MDAIKQRAKNVDLITFPKGIESINCYNCRWIKDKKHGEGYCSNKEVLQNVTSHMCCNLWDSKGTTRSWKEGKKEMSHIDENRINSHAKSRMK